MFRLRRSYRDACRDATGRRRRRDSVGTISLIPSNMSGSVEQWVFVDLRAIHTKKTRSLTGWKKIHHVSWSAPNVFDSNVELD